LAGAGVGMGTLAAHRKPFTMTQPAIRAEIHQPLDVYRHEPAQIAFDRIFTVDQFAHPQYFVIGQFVHPPLRWNANTLADLASRSMADAMDISEPDGDPLLIGNVDTSYPRHLRLSLKTSRDNVGSPRRKGKHSDGVAPGVNRLCGRTHGRGRQRAQASDRSPPRISSVERATDSIAAIPSTVLRMLRAR